MASCHRLSFAIAIAASFIAPWLTPLAADAQAQTQAPARAQAAKALTLDALYHPDKKVDFTAGGRALPIWLDDSSYILQPMRPGAGGGAGAGGDDGKIVKVDAATLSLIHI